MDKRSGRSSSSKGKKTANGMRKKNSVRSMARPSAPRKSLTQETKKISTVSDETKRYKFDEEELKDAQTKTSKRKLNKQGKKKPKKKKKNLKFTLEVRAKQ